MPRTVPMGSVSSGTHRNEDLIPAFADMLDSLKEARSLDSDYVAGNELGAAQEFARIDMVLAEIEHHQQADGYYDSEEAGGDLDLLFEELNNFAPPCSYFGAHPGDGADFGFWLSEDVGEDFDGEDVAG